MTGQRRNVYYGSLHNEGFTTGGMIPGKKVPARNWFGIPKEYKKGGKRYEEASRQMRFRLRRSLQSAMKKVA
jgi:phage gpG-like protein